MQTTSTSRVAVPAASPIRRFVGRHIYRWHRTLGLVTVVPVLMWTLSGLSHPLMSNLLRPFIAHETVPSPPLSAAKLALPVAQVLTQNHLAAVQNVRVVHYRREAMYQVADFRGGCATLRPLPATSCPAATGPMPRTWPATCWPIRPRPSPVPST
ncbi:hypothetical protein [Hymenobacter sp. BRD67]|uniref:hypothetical protein n=1 Tax=Hymenobacter sp. BRD67 TaxID=2675877 RepID=UPI0015669698|nr:hypothetical protein [Hymenobacter sp. BRD67]QKG51457.1 hypothetical protein GKZ67_01220 [Hymenobacter sp. BRD67]